MPFLWVEAPSAGLEEIETAFAADETIDNVELIADLGDERLYQMNWIRRIEVLVRVLVEEAGTVLSALGTAECWHLRLLFPSRDALSRTYEYCESNGIGIEILSIYDIDESRHGRFGLTDEQQDTVAAAFEAGYYEIPRKADLEALAADSISPTRHSANVYAVLTEALSKTPS